jgi:hypothetical protein
MEFVFKRTLLMLMLAVGFLIVGLAVTSSPSLSLGQAAYAGEDGCDEDNSCGGGGGGGGSDSGGSPSGGVNTGGGGTAASDESGAPVLPIALGGLGAVAGGSLLLRRFAKQDG